MENAQNITIKINAGDDSFEKSIPQQENKSLPSLISSLQEAMKTTNDLLTKVIDSQVKSNNGDKKNAEKNDSMNTDEDENEEQDGSEDDESDRKKQKLEKDT
ncbi:uncharacterized protein LOC134827318 [Culicoides brevitarsis]|uniref:uncharacterized protein LOC134827318 n=1 Tax=Culicoides brevitarsis TaxID=469753 RepID=UPI00307B6E0D